MTTYKIIRFYANDTHESQVIRRGLSLEQAQEHCQDPETSSRTAKSREAKQRTAIYGPWFDGYTEE